MLFFNQNHDFTYISPKKKATWALKIWINKYFKYIQIPLGCKTDALSLLWIRLPIASYDTRAVALWHLHFVSTLLHVVWSWQWNYDRFEPFAAYFIRFGVYKAHELLTPFIAVCCLQCTERVFAYVIFNVLMLLMLLDCIWRTFQWNNKTSDRASFGT